MEIDFQDHGVVLKGKTLEMKNIFGYDVTDKENIVCVFEKFKDRSISKELKEEMILQREAYWKSHEEAELSKILKVIKNISGMASLCSFFVGSSNLKYNEYTACYVFAVSFLIYIITKLYERKKIKEFFNGDELKKITQDCTLLNKKIAEQIYIPEEVQEIDVLFEKYIEKNGKYKLKDFGFSGCRNISLRFFEEDQSFCVTDNENVYKFPYISVRGISYTKHRATFMEWNKEDLYNSKKYKNFKIVRNGFGVFYVKGLKVELNIDGEEYYIMVPLYEKEKIMKIAHLTDYGEFMAVEER